MVQPEAYTDSILRYFAYYGLNPDQEAVGPYEHVFGTFESDDNILAAHFFEPTEYRATVLVLHGYLSHCGQLSHLIKYLLLKNYAVATYDMRGHGLSTGERAAVDYFSQYGRALSDFVDVTRLQLKGPYHLIGHSMGGSAAIDYLLTSEEPIFMKVILVAPLIRSIFWRSSRIAYCLCSQFVKRVPRIFSHNSSDREFLSFIRSRDPLQARTVPLKWINAMFEWNDKIIKCRPCNMKIMIIQGLKDRTVDWKFNIRIINEKFRNAELSFVDEGRHELFNESFYIRQEVFSQITGYLQNG